MDGTIWLLTTKMEAKVKEKKKKKGNSKWSIKYSIGKREFREKETNPLAHGSERKRKKKA